MPSIHEKTFAVAYIIAGTGQITNIEIKAANVGVAGDFVLLLDENGKGLAAFPGKSVISVKVKTEPAS